jgi:ribosomal protein S18 acetylase RimI-like enzyme
VVADAADLTRLHIAAWRAAYRGLVPDPVLDDLTELSNPWNWGRRLVAPAPESRYWAIEWAGRVVGCAGTGVPRDEDLGPGRFAELYGLYLDPGLWNRGLGRALVDYALADLRDRGFTDVVLWVLRGNARGRRFYEKLGFVADGAEKMAKRGDADVPEVRYRRGLSGDAK